MRFRTKFTRVPLLAVGLLWLAGCSGTISDTLESPSGAGAATGSGLPAAAGGQAGSGSARGGNGSGAGAGMKGAGAAAGSGAASGAASGGAASLGPAPAVFGELTRLTKAEYASTVEAAFGVAPDLSLIPDDGRIGLYTSNASVSPDPVHPYLLAAEELALALVPSELPACDSTGAEACLRESYGPALEALYRRPLRDAEVTQLGGLLTGLVADGLNGDEATRAVLVSALLSPDFLFRASPVATDDAGAARRLAETLSYALWDAPPDAALAAATKASASELGTRLREEATRLSRDSRATPVLARFLAQWLRVDTDLKMADPAFATSPRFLELMAYVDDALATNAPVRDLVAGQRGFVHEDNAAAYGLDAVSGKGPVVAVDWSGNSLRRGLLSEDLVADATRHPDEGRRPIFRGKLVRVSLLCDTLTAPSAELLALNDEVGDRTVDARCKGCHQLLDPIGRTFASLDPDHEGDVPAAEIVLHPGLEGTYADLPALLTAIAGSRSFAECFSRHFLAFFLEQPLEAADANWVKELADVVEAGASLAEVAAHTIATLETRASLAVPWCEGP